MRERERETERERERERKRERIREKERENKRDRERERERDRQRERERERERVREREKERENKRERERDTARIASLCLMTIGLSMTVRYCGHHCTQLRLGVFNPVGRDGSPPTLIRVVPRTEKERDREGEREVYSLHKR